MHISYRFRLRSTLRVLSVVLAVLVVLDFAAQFGRYSLHLPRRLVDAFDADQKTNFPTGFKLLMLAGSALLLDAIARAKRLSNDRWRRHWRWLSGIFLFLFFDELVTFHQGLSNGVRREASARGAFYYPWASVYLAALVVFLIAFAGFYRALPRRYQILFLLAGAGFAGGSGGLELVKGATADRLGEFNLTFGLVAAVSDSAEMIGLLVFVGALLHYARTAVPSVTVWLAESPATGDKPLKEVPTSEATALDA